MTRPNRVSTASLLFTALVGLTLGACTLEPKMIGGETEGDEDCQNGDMMPAEDGCNDCTCVDGAWACTEKACGETGPSPVCEEGETKLADDGCNDCICAGGEWGCTKMVCPPAECEPGTSKMEDCNTCDCHEGGWVCTDLACGESVCGDGVVDADEQCDDGNSIDDDKCPNDCGLGGTTGETGETGETGSTGLCGDGVVEGSEQCDDGNVVDDDGCTNLCMLGGMCDPGDPLTIDGATIEADTLNVEVTYGGGCLTHVIDKCWNGIFATSLPVQTWVVVTHDDQGDVCKALVSETRPIDLSALKIAYQEAFNAQNGTIVIHLEGWPNTLDYTF